MLAYTSDRFVLPLPPGHRFPMSKYALLRQAVEDQSPAIRLQEAPLASEAELLLAHTPAYVRAVFNGELSAAQQREIGFPWSDWMVERARRSVGATLAAARTALWEGVSANLAGGTHHASADKGSGFCVFNDVAVACRVLQAEQAGGMQMLVIDLDVHQGNGTAEIFAGDDSVFTFSMHGDRNFPFRKAQSDLDVPLPDGCSDGPYLTALQAALEDIAQRMAARPPALAFYLAGADPHEGDRLGRMKLSADGLAQRDQLVLAWLRQRRIPVALSMAGGYGHDIATTVALQHRSLQLAAQSWSAWSMEESAYA